MAVQSRTQTGYWPLEWNERAHAGGGGRRGVLRQSGGDAVPMELSHRHALIPYGAPEQSVRSGGAAHRGPLSPSP